MKPQFKPKEIYLDLSKLSKEQIKSLPQILENAGEIIGFHTLIRLNSGKLKDDFVLYLNSSFEEWCLWNHIFQNKQELTYSQFLDMMGESEEKSKVIENSEKELINNDGTLYIGEGLENYYKDQLERTGKFKVVSIEDYNKLQILLNHKPNPDYQSDPFPGQLG